LLLCFLSATTIRLCYQKIVLSKVTFSDKLNLCREGGGKGGERYLAAAAKMADEVIIVGGMGSHGNRLDDVWTLSLNSYTWTEIKAGNGPKPPSRWMHSLTAVSQRHAILIGGWGMVSLYWEMNIVISRSLLMF
jgi:hypothetical protein